MPPEGKKKKRRRQEWKADDFRVICDLPERLARYLRELLHLDKATLDFAVDKIRQHKAGKAKAYKEWSKSKGKGKGRRYFAAPCDELKVVQKAILQRFLAMIMVHSCRHGNQPGSSILTNVGRHAGFAKTVYSIDIINAFPTVFRSRVYANLNKPLRYALRQFAGVEFSKEDIGLLLNALCDLVCLHDRLPQGPPTSPRILDIVCGKMDQEMWGMLQANSTAFQSYRYTAWADDITISSDGEIPEEVREAALKVIRDNGFIPHVRPDKTKYYSPQTGEVPIVTGIVINGDGRLTMAPAKANQLRAVLFNALRHHEWNSELTGKVNGTLGYIRQLYPEKLPSALRDVVERCEQRLRETKAALQPEPAPKATTKKRAASKSKAEKLATKKRPSKKKGDEAKDETLAEVGLPEPSTNGVAH